MIDIDINWAEEGISIINNIKHPRNAERRRACYIIFGVGLGVPLCFWGLIWLAQNVHIGVAFCGLAGVVGGLIMIWER